MTSVALLISGGQTGVDRGALIGAAIQGVKHGGWCPKGRLAEDGKIPPEFPMTEATSDKYEDRTRLNVECADATLILTYEREPTGGTKLTLDLAQQIQQPVMVMTLERAATIEQDKAAAKAIRAWIAAKQPKTLNVAGPRESKAAGIKDHAAQVISLVFQTRAKCVCGRQIPPQVWERPEVKESKAPLRCSSCGHNTYASDFAS
jgi:hypothetical protein